MSYTEQYNPMMPQSGGVASAMIGQPRTESELESIAARIYRIAANFDETGGKLRDHADNVHGSTPPPPMGNEACPCRMGQLGAIHDAIDRLERVHAFVAEQAGRNCTLA